MTNTTKQIRVHFSEVASSQADAGLTATRYFPSKEISRDTSGVNHVAMLSEQLSHLGWIETSERVPGMYQGRKTNAVEYERGRSVLFLTTYKQGQTIWAFVKIMGLGSDVIELRDWMTQYESSYGRLKV